MNKPLSDFNRGYNASCHKSAQIKKLKWASQSPDINPIEQVWAHFKKIISKQVNQYENFDKFQEFAQITFLSSKELRKTIQNTIYSVTKNLNKLIELRSDPVK